MKIIRYIAFSLSALPLTYLLTNWWLNSRWSEITWTWLNQLFKQNLGLASDIEFIVTIACSFVISLTISLFCFVYFSMLLNGRAAQVKRIVTVIKLRKNISFTLSFMHFSLFRFSHV